MKTMLPLLLLRAAGLWLVRKGEEVEKKKKK